MKTLFLGSASLFTSAMLTFAGNQVVTNHNDQGTGSLRAAIANAASGDTITFTLPTPNTITLTTGELFIDKNLVITGPGADLLTVARDSTADSLEFPIFLINAGHFAVTISGLTISNGSNAGVISSANGGGLDNQSSGIVNISECTFSENQAYDDGGGLCQNGSGTTNLTDCIFSGNGTVAGFGGGLAVEDSDSSVNLLRCIIDSNTAGYSGAGIYSFGGSSVTMTDSTISNNFLTASDGAGDGSGIFNTGTLTLERCTIANNTNQRGSGGGIQNQGVLTANNSTFFGNTAEFNGGAIENDGPAIITNCTITDNTASQASPYGIVNGGGGISVFGNSFAVAMLKSTIVAENHSPTNPDVAGLSGGIASSGYNLVGDGTGGTITPATGDQIGTFESPIDPLLGPLADNGGPTKTCALLAGSPAINAGDPDAPAVDQRNYDRQDAPDIGAFESGATIPMTLANISTRLLVETGDDVLIGGFIVTGTHSKAVLLRAIGPSLSLDGKLADPVLELHDSKGTIISSNDNWQTNTNKQAIIDTGIPPTDLLESALLITLDPGVYTAVVRGANNGTGIAVVEAYDLDQTTDARLANISTRGLVQSGDNVMIGGFIILGSEDEDVLMRAIGPSLPVSGNLADPTLELHDAQGSILATNDNWRDTQEAEIEATGIPPTNDAESAIVSTLAPGGYTAIVRGVGNTTGIALVEAYGLD
jgi:hypothetical protein